MNTLNRQKCQEISVFPQDHLMLLQLQTGEIHILPQKSRKGAAQSERPTDRIILLCSDSNA
jgi:hypothetical protein